MRTDYAARGWQSWCVRSRPGFATYEIDLMDQPEQNLRVLPPKEAADRAGLSVRTLQRKVRAREFVQPVKLSDHRIGFFEHEVQAWLAALPRTREAA